MGFWDHEHAARIDPERFRAHDQYLEQKPSYPYRELVEYIRSIGRGDRLTLMGEDGAFGCVTAEVDGITVSRDLLDSVLEIWWLQQHVDLSHARALDIGAGYGRIVYRMRQVYAGACVIATDSVRASRAACRAYLEHRSVPFGILLPEDVQHIGRLDLAINVHSWSECTLPEVVYWLDELTRLQVPRLFIIPHEPNMYCWTPEPFQHGPSYRPELESRGWQLKHAWDGPACCPRTYQLWERT